MHINNSQKIDFMDQQSWQNFLLGFRNDVSKKTYAKKMSQFLVEIKSTPDELLMRAKADPKQLEKTLLTYAEQRKQEISGSSLALLRSALKHFFVMNDAEQIINWSKLTLLMPKARKFGADRSPTVEEIRRILDNCNLRMKCVVMILCSSGIRIGALEHLRWADVEEQWLPGKGKRLGKLTIYRGEDDEYVTFTSPECYEFLMEYRAMRERSGEEVTYRSALITLEKWNRASEKGKPLPVSSKALANEIGKTLHKIGIRAGHRKIHEFKQVHGFRKFFKTKCENSGISSMIVEIMMGHKAGLSRSYYKPTPQELLSHYLKAVPYLTISEAEQYKDVIQKKVAYNDRKMGEVERQGALLSQRLSNIETDFKELKRFVHQLEGIQ